MDFETVESRPLSSSFPQWRVCYSALTNRALRKDFYKRRDSADGYAVNSTRTGRTGDWPYTLGLFQKHNCGIGVGAIAISGKWEASMRMTLRVERHDRTQSVPVPSSLLHMETPGAHRRAQGWPLAA